MLTRRTFLAAAGAAVIPRPGLAIAAGPLTFWGPPAAPSIVLAHAVASGALKEIDASAAFKIWRTPDEMRAGLSSGTMEAVIVPTNVAANLHNRGLDVRLLNIMTRGLLYVVAGEKIMGIEDLRGKTIAVPFRSDMPDFVLQRLLARAGLNPQKDVKFDYGGTPPEAMQMLLAGRVDAALLAEPAATAAILRAKLGLTHLARAIDCQKEWSRTIGGSGFIPQAGLAVTRGFVDRIGQHGLKTLQDALQATVNFVVNNPLRASLASVAQFGVMSPVVAEAVPYSNLIALPASSVRSDLESFFSLLAEDDPRIIGGKLPSDAFYAL
ncbi:ABC transporter substrate-binding protein [Bradyrhizobium cenepequi]|uniref:ABC transporter substrate-binding protein n=1 Tax=Bradyrhizobium cenepequi TaxID=2821403 RepID=UPI001CE346BA|nr:PhnD/SsuA/transferrin family substrate-binding protein [Bradyrhizobium cenepequi]MCA6105871.1 ABC transporter substrate-binding protein [Bradyrhizobium cenepequi]